MESLEKNIDQTESQEQIPPSQETLMQLETLEKDTHTTKQCTELEKEMKSLQIDLSDGIDDRERAIFAYIVEDFFDNFLEEWGLDDVTEETKEALIQRMQIHGYTTQNLDALAHNLHHQATKIEGLDPAEKKRSIQKLLLSSMGGYLLDQIDTAVGELPIHEQFAILAELQQFADDLDEEQKERKRQLREQILADLFEWKNLEIYEVVIDASGSVIITLQDPQGERVTIAYDPTNGDLSRIDAGAVDDIVPADQAKIANVIESVRAQQSLPYDPDDTGTLLQFLDGVI